jgi:tetratricopeptide (TPR) repeat protein
MQVSSKHVIISAIIAAVLVIGVVAWYSMRAPAIPDRTVLSDRPEMLGYYDRALEYEKKIKEDPSQVLNYIVVGSEWRMIGSLTKDEKWSRLSLDAYERGISATGFKNSLLMSNAAVAAQELGEYERAKKHLLNAIDLSPGDVSYHLAYIDLLRYKFKASEFDVLRAYDDAMKRVLGGADLVSSRMVYLKTIGRLDDAQADLELLFKNNLLTNKQYEEEVAEIANLRKKSK